ncbi:MAG TPA: sugar kinase [Terracidiphilus sp.]|nr:sugar kinase [Terracidiphilus sp.]
MARFDITIAGELNLDLILYGLPEALPPERELLASDMALTLGSSSAIVAHNLASLGCKVGFSSCIGADSFGQFAIDRLGAAGVDISTVRKLGSTARTGLTVILAHEKWRNILTYPGTIAALKPEHLDMEYLSSARHFHLSSYYLQKGLQGQVPELLKELKSAGLTISLDTNDDPDDLWEGGLNEVLPLVDVLLPNEREAMKIACCDSLEPALVRLTEQVPLVVVKRGGQGAVACRGNERLYVPAVKLDMVDAVGAGDSFDAGFLSEFVRGADLEACLFKGNLAGALCITRAGGTEAFRDCGHRESFFRQHVR